MINNRYEFVVLFDVENGNPNGDPDYANSPRIDHETGYGFVTDVCLKRKIRNYVQLRSCVTPEEYPLAAIEEKPGFDILIKPDHILNDAFRDAYEACGRPTGLKGKNADDTAAARDYMCRNYFDVRAFGAVMSTGDDPCGIVRGPVQINFARSISPIYVNELTITRQAKTSKERGDKAGTTEMGRKSIIPYALYRAEGYVSAALANRITGLSEDDLSLLWEAVINMFEDDHSAARGKMCTRHLYVFRHDSVLGNCPSHILFDKIKVTEKNPGVPPRAFSDYEIDIDREMPDGVELIVKL